MVTIDIEDTCIRMLVVEGKKVVQAASLPLEPGLVEGGVVVDKSAVGQRIEALRATHGITEKQVAVSISGIHSIYRVVSLPGLPKGMLAEAARREMERAMPVPLEELYTSWDVVTLSATENLMCLAGVPRNTIDAMLEALHEAGLQSQLMDLRPLALARVADEKDAIVINVQPASFDIVVMIDGIPQLLRSLSLPSEELSPSDRVLAVKEELDRTVTFYNTSHRANPITGSIYVFLSGQLEEISEEALGYPVKLLPELVSSAEGFDAGEYAVNIGLALKQVSVPESQVRVNMNLVPEAYLPVPRPVIQVVSWVFVVFGIVVLVPLGWLTFSEVSQTAQLQARVDDARQQVQARQATQAARQELQGEIDDAQAVRDAFQQLLDDFEGQRWMVNGDLSAVTSLLPGTIELNSISYEETQEEESVVTEATLQVGGVAPDEATILDYSRGLRDSGNFSEVLVSSMEEVEFNELDFTLTLEASGVE